MSESDEKPNTFQPGAGESKGHVVKKNITTKGLMQKNHESASNV